MGTNLQQKAISALPANRLSDLFGLGQDHNFVPKGASPQYSPNNPALMKLLGGSLAHGGDVSWGQAAAGGAFPLMANTNANSTSLQDIARAMSLGRPITDAQWKQAGLPPGGGQTGTQLKSALADPAAPWDGSIPPSNSPYIGPGALPIPTRDPNSLVAPTYGQAPNIAPLIQQNMASRPMPQTLSPRAFQSIYAGSR